MTETVKIHEKVVKMAEIGHFHTFLTSRGPRSPYGEKGFGTGESKIPLSQITSLPGGSWPEIVRKRSKSGQKVPKMALFGPLFGTFWSPKSSQKVDMFTVLEDRET